MYWFCSASPVDLKSLNADKLKQLSRDADEKRLNQRVESFDLVYPPDGVIQKLGNCLPESVALHMHRGTMADWMENRQRLTADVRSKICTFLRKNQKTKIAGVKCVLGLQHAC